MYIVFIKPVVNLEVTFYVIKVPLNFGTQVFSFSFENKLSIRKPVPLVTTSHLLLNSHKTKLLRHTDIKLNSWLLKIFRTCVLKSDWEGEEEFFQFYSREIKTLFNCFSKHYIEFVNDSSSVFILFIWPVLKWHYEFLFNYYRPHFLKLVISFTWYNIRHIEAKVAISLLILELNIQFMGDLKLDCF